MELELINNIITQFQATFSLETLKETLSSPEAWAAIISLIILEGLLSADNALVIAVMVKHLPEEQQKKAMRYGIFGAYAFRVIAIMLGMWLVQFSGVILLGGAYLIYLGISNLIKTQDEETQKAVTRSFWRTVLAVELVDIVFSIDSVIAAFGVSDDPWVILIGSMFGILMIRFAAGILLSWIKKVPELEYTAFILVAIIGVKLVLQFFGVHIGEILFFAILGGVIGGTFILNKSRTKRGYYLQK